MQQTQVSNLTEQVIDLIFRSLQLPHIDKSTVNSNTPITKDGLNLDSVDILEIVVQLEHHFNFKVAESEAYNEHFKNIGTLTMFVESKLSKA